METKNPVRTKIYPSEYDFLHLTPEGHRILAERLAEVVKNRSEYEREEIKLKENGERRPGSSLSFK